jgi:DNA processing protein
VVEAAAKSGSLIIARNAADQGRDVLAVPGHPFDARASGCNILLRAGATLIRNAADVLEVLGAQQTAPQPQTTSAQIVSHWQTQPRHTRASAPHQRPNQRRKICMLKSFHSSGQPLPPKIR